MFTQTHSEGKGTWAMAKSEVGNPLQICLKWAKHGFNPWFQYTDLLLEGRPRRWCNSTWIFAMLSRCYLTDHLNLTVTIEITCKYKCCATGLNDRRLTHQSFPQTWPQLFHLKAAERRQHFHQEDSNENSQKIAEFLRHHNALVSRRLTHARPIRPCCKNTPGRLLRPYYRQVHQAYCRDRTSGRHTRPTAETGLAAGTPGLLQRPD